MGLLEIVERMDPIEVIRAGMIDVSTVESHGIAQGRKGIGTNL
jgi:hypothetical protein